MHLRKQMSCNRELEFFPRKNFPHTFCGKFSSHFPRPTSLCVISNFEASMRNFKKYLGSFGKIGKDCSEKYKNVDDEN